MFEDFIVTNHIMERYEQRTHCLRKDIMKRIKKDLHFTKVKKIINNGNIRHVFTFHSKEFIFVNDCGKWILRTIIKRTQKENEYAMMKRMKQAGLVA